MFPKNILILITSLSIQFAASEDDNRVITTLMHSRFYVKPTIVNGEPAARAEIPYLVSFKEPLNNIYKLKFWRNLCGGSIIKTDRVLTAAHCFEGNKFYYARNPHILRIIAGNTANDAIHSGDTFSSENGQWRKIKKLILHEDFVFPNNDIALVIVDEDWLLTEGVDFITIASRHSDYTRNCKSAGFGRLGHSLNAKLAPVLLVARINVISRRLCSKIWEMDMSTFICTNSAWTDVARGDSGGPLACYDTFDPNELSGRDLLVGIVSGKNFDKSTIFTRVSAYHDWINRNDGSKFECVTTFLSIILFILSYILVLILT